MRTALIALVGCAVGSPALAQAPSECSVAAQTEPEEPPLADSGPASWTDLREHRQELMAPGTNVYLEGMVVRGKSGRTLRVGRGKQELFVIPVDPTSVDYMAVGAKVDVRGMLVETPSAGQAKLVYAMSGREARRIARQRVIVDAWSVTTVK
ncbi:MAG: hypothetical protein SFX73_24575 [Kofleriaceae bacterium]|nr:hypothetical protein [Kofleriaceae bacterium]